MTWLVDHEADLVMVRNGPVAWSVMALLGLRPDREAWLWAALEHGLGHAVSPLVSRCVDHGEMSVELATHLLSNSGGRSAIINSVVSCGQDPQLVSLVVQSLKVEDIQGLDSSYAIGHAPDATRTALFTHADASVRSNAAALWAAERSYSAEEMPHDPDWVVAMSDLVVPSASLRDHMQSKALEVLARTTPDAYMNLLVKHVEALEGAHGFDEWAESARELSSAHRFALWDRVRESPMAKNLFWILSAGDVNWIAEAVSDPTFPVSLSSLLHATRFQNGKRYTLEVLAGMLRPLNWQPDDLLWTIELGTRYGDEHERLERHLKVCLELAESPEPDLARLGERGVEVFEPRLTQARQAAHQAAVRGTLNY